MRFKLLSPHYLPGDRYVEAGTVIGDGTAYPIDFTAYPPTHEMEGLDAPAETAATAAANAFMKVDPIESLPLTLKEAAK